MGTKVSQKVSPFFIEAFFKNATCLNCLFVLPQIWEAVCSKTCEGEDVAARQKHNVLGEGTPAITVGVIADQPDFFILHCVWVQFEPRVEAKAG